jgi:membrane peptidoglycan carboxypeptidase
MNSYGHPQPDGYDGYDSYGQYQDAYAADSYGADPYPEDSYGRGSARATASVGAASAGRARVAPPATEPPRPRYDWSRGRSAGVAPAPVSPGGPATGRATVRPGGPGGPAGPAGTGPGGEGRPARKKKRHWLRNTILIALAVMIISTGGGMVALSYYVDTVPPPEDLTLEEGSTIYFADGSKMATLQEVNRQIIDTTVPELETVRNAVIAAEDKNFYDHSGVDFMGIVRAAFKNTTGSADRSGASTIDMQYTRAAADLTEDSYSRKLKEAAMAYKLNQAYDKDQILDFYLNQVYFGRGAYGIQAAAKAYFNKPADELSAGEAAVLAATIRTPDGGEGVSPYDPAYNPDDPSIALERWNYVLDQMVDIGALPAAERAELTELPEVIEPRSPNEPLKGRNGTLVRQVTYELEEMGITDVKTGGYRITTTIDKDIQKAALEAVPRSDDIDYWEGMPDNVHSALVAVDPKTGGVLAYWGGKDGTGDDYAGPIRDEEGNWYGGFPPGSSSKIYTLVAALREGVSFNSRWNSCPTQGASGQCEYYGDGDYLEKPVRNAGREASNCDGQGANYCSLRSSTQQSLNIPFYQFSEAVPNNEGPAKILQAAKDAGISIITDDDDTLHDVAGTEVAEIAPKFIGHQVAFGQYKITVLDHANGVATIANRGVYNQAHFVETVEQRNKETGEWEPIEGSRITGEQRVLPEHADAITEVLTAVPGLNDVPMEGGRPAAAKTGTWENANGGNGDAWVVGYTPQIASAVWVGDPDRDSIVDGNGNPIGSRGLPAFIWKRFMDAAHAAKEYQFEQFPPANPVGDPDHEYATGVQPEQPRQNCRFPFFGCDNDDDGDDDDDRGNNNGGGGTIVPPGDEIIPTLPPTEPDG